MQDKVSLSGTVPNDGPDARMARYWNGSATAPWVTLQDRLDALLGPPGVAALSQVNPGVGEHVLDVGCGCGATTLEFASRVGKSGRVFGVDISEQMKPENALSREDLRKSGWHSRTQRPIRLKRALSIIFILAWALCSSALQSPPSPIFDLH